jgi:hypothetical protein
VARLRFLQVIVSQMSVADTCLGAGARDRRGGGSCPDIGSWVPARARRNWLLTGTEESDSLVRIADRHVIEDAEVGAVTFRHIR